MWPIFSFGGVPLIILVSAVYNNVLSISAITEASSSGGPSAQTILFNSQHPSRSGTLTLTIYLSITYT